MNDTTSLFTTSNGKGPEVSSQDIIGAILRAGQAAQQSLEDRVMRALFAPLRPVPMPFSWGPPEVRDFSGPYGPDRAPFWIAIHMDGRRELVSEQPVRFAMKFFARFAGDLVRFPRHSLMILDAV